jgi:hypothetical protein
MGSREDGRPGISAIVADVPRESGIAGLSAPKAAYFKLPTNAAIPPSIESEANEDLAVARRERFSRVNKYRPPSGGPGNTLGGPAPERAIK